MKKPERSSRAFSNESWRGRTRISRRFGPTGKKATRGTTVTGPTRLTIKRSEGERECPEELSIPAQILLVRLTAETLNEERAQVALDVGRELVGRDEEAAGDFFGGHSRSIAGIDDSFLSAG